MTSADSASPDEYATWDAPYVLGALDQQERLAYEAHLETCAQCRAAVAELSGLPGLLSRVPGEVALALGDEAEPAGSRAAAAVFGDAGFEALLDRVRSSVDPNASAGSESAAGTSAPADGSARTHARGPAGAVRSLDTARERRRSRSGPWLALAGAVAAAAAAVAVTIPATIAITQQENPPATQQAILQRPMDQVVPSPITADFTLTPVDTGTRVNMSCRYATSDTDYTWDGALWVVHTDGTQSMIAQWSAHPGEEITAGGITAVPADQISSVEIRSSTTNQVFLRGSAAA